MTATQYIRLQHQIQQKRDEAIAAASAICNEVKTTPTEEDLQQRETALLIAQLWIAADRGEAPRLRMNLKNWENRTYRWDSPRKAKARKQAAAIVRADFQKMEGQEPETTNH